MFLTCNPETNQSTTYSSRLPSTTCIPQPQLDMVLSSSAY